MNWLIRDGTEGAGLWNDESAQGMTEYGLILGLTVIVCLATATAMGGEFRRFFYDVVAAIDAALASVSS